MYSHFWTLSVGLLKPPNSTIMKYLEIRFTSCKSFLFYRGLYSLKEPRKGHILYAFIKSTLSLDNCLPIVGVHASFVTTLWVQLIFSKNILYDCRVHICLSKRLNFVTHGFIWAKQCFTASFFTSKLLWYFEIR